MGSPGAGKTVVSRMLGKLLDMPVLDIDDHVLEPAWGVPASQKLQDIGPEAYIKAEGEVLMNLSVSGHVVSLTGSNPMHLPAMDKFRQTGLLVFLDVDSQDILARLKKMKVNRIVGQGTGMSMSDILDYRQQFYENDYDIRVVSVRNESVQDQAQNVLNAIQKFRQRQQYVSTRQTCQPDEDKGFLSVLREGLAPDGGLFVPARLPHFSLGQWERLVGLSYQNVALRILEQWISPADIHPTHLRQMINKAYHAQTFSQPRIAPIRFLKDNLFVHELYHGPTASFKDLALQLMPQMFDVAANGLSRGIIVATSGDTGSAALDGFGRHTSVPTMVLYPYQGVSAIQRLQMTTCLHSNSHVMGIDGDFDFCQSLVKEILKSGAFSLSSANSINWGRLLVQVVYHAFGYLEMVQSGTIRLGDPVCLCIPTGNFGNVLAAYYAQKMGIPLSKFIVASNSNNVLTEFITTGKYRLRGRSLQKTISPAIDILKSSNLERLLYHLTQSPSQVQQHYQSLQSEGTFDIETSLLDILQEQFSADWCSDKYALKTINEVFYNNGILLDPHTSVAVTVATRKGSVTDRPVIVSATAHSAKFPNDVLAALKPGFSFAGADLLNELKQICGENGVHWNLDEVVRQPEVHKTVCTSKSGKVLEEVKKFFGK